MFSKLDSSCNSVLKNNDALPIAMIAGMIGTQIPKRTNPFELSLGGFAVRARSSVPGSETTALSVPLFRARSFSPDSDLKSGQTSFFRGSTNRSG